MSRDKYLFLIVFFPEGEVSYFGDINHFFLRKKAGDTIIHFLKDRKQLRKYGDEARH
jgi:hypothetical protein